MDDSKARTWQLDLRPVRPRSLRSHGGDAGELALAAVGEVQARIEELTRTVEKLEALTGRIEHLEHITMNMDALDELSARVAYLERQLVPRERPLEPGLAASRRLREPGTRLSAATRDKEPRPRPRRARPPKDGGDATPG